MLQQAYATKSDTSNSDLQAWFYELQAGEGALLAEHDYLGSVESMQLNGQWAAALFEGELLLYCTPFTKQRIPHLATTQRAHMPNLHHAGSAAVRTSTLDSAAGADDSLHLFT